MNVHIRGRYRRDDGQWIVEVPSLEIQISESSVLKAFQNIQLHFEKELRTLSTCTFWIQDDGQFEVKISSGEDFVDYLANRVKAINPTSNQLNEMLMQIKFQSDLE